MVGRLLWEGRLLGRKADVRVKADGGKATGCGGGSCGQIFVVNSTH